MEVRVNRSKQKVRRHKHDGFTLLQAIIVLAIAMVVSGATVLSIRAGRPGFQLANSAHQLAVHLERARADSVRRRAEPGSESRVEILNATTYRVTMGWGGSGTLTSRDFTLEGDVVFDSNLTTIAFDWRGRPTGGTEIALALRNSAGPMNVDVTGSGDVTVRSEFFQDQAIPEVVLKTEVDGDVSPAPTPQNPHVTTPPITEESATPTPPGGTSDATPTPSATATPTPTPNGSGSGNGSGGTGDRGNPNATPTPTPTQSESPAACAPSVSPSRISISKSGGSATLLVTIASGSGTVTATGPANLSFTPDSLTLDSGQTGNLTITSNDNTRGEFTVTLKTPCGSTSVIVTVTN